ncbi:GTP-binding protein [Microbacterium koreense]|uniref:GTP-binding protein n=1 Tax=Microbacterium koreense TaxID=323761 RepID=A0ABW2ZPZ6_9MICO
MEAVDVVAVVGACGPERRRFAARLAASMSAELLPASRLEGSPDPCHEAAVLSSWTTGAVVELPDETLVTEAIGAFTEAEARTNLRALVCVVDASHILDDLQREDYLSIRDDHSGVAAILIARAELIVKQIEYASVIVLVNWANVETRPLAMLMALLSSLSPRARLWLHRVGGIPVERGEVYGAGQDRAGWVCALNGDHDPHMIDGRVRVYRYEEPRPFHPGRLRKLLDRIEVGEFGTVVRSVGFCRLVTRPYAVAHWEHVGGMFTLHPMSLETPFASEAGVLAVGQDLAFFGFDLDIEALGNALGEASLTPAELDAGPTAWATFPDPFPAWVVAPDRAD